MKRISFFSRFLCACAAASCVLSGCGVDDGSGAAARLEMGEIAENSIVITVGETGVKYSEVRNYCYLLKRQYENTYGRGLWDFDIGKNFTIGDEARQEIVNLITQLKVIKKTAEEEKIALTVDETDEAVQQAEQIMDGATKRDKKKYCLNLQGMTELYEDNMLAEKMFYISTDDADTTVSDDEARQADIQYIEIITKGVDRNGNNIDMNARARQEAYKRAVSLRKAAVKSNAFLSFAEENSDSSNSALTVGKGSDEMGDAALEAAMSLKSGEISDVVQSSGTGSDGYYIIFCVDENNEEATHERKEEIIEQRQTDMFKSKYSRWLAECNVNISQEFWENFEM